MSQVKKDAAIRNFQNSEKIDKEMRELHLEEVRVAFLEKYRLARKQKALIEREIKKMRMALVDEEQASVLDQNIDMLITKMKHETFSVDLDIEGLKQEFLDLFNEDIDG